jgi:probable HAF family extracellular repeat protein
VARSQSLFAALVKYTDPHLRARKEEALMRSTVARSGWFWLLLIVGLIGGAPATATAEFVFTTIDVPGAQFTNAFDINNAGQIVGASFETTGAHGFLLTGGVFTTIDVPGAADTFASGINDAGQIVGMFNGPISSPDFFQLGFLNTGGVFTTIDVPGAIFGTQAFGINDAGQIVGGFTDATPTGHGFLLTGGVFTTIDVPAP